MLLFGAKEVCERRRSAQVAPVDRFEAYRKRLTPFEEGLDAIQKHYNDTTDPLIKRLHSLPKNDKRRKDIENQLHQARENKVTEYENLRKTLRN